MLAYIISYVLLLALIFPFEALVYKVEVGGFLKSSLGHKLAHFFLGNNI